VKTALYKEEQEEENWKNSPHFRQIESQCVKPRLLARWSAPLVFILGYRQMFGLFRLPHYRSSTNIKYRIWFSEKYTFSGKFCARQWSKRESVQINGLIHCNKADVVFLAVAVTSTTVCQKKHKTIEYTNKTQLKT